jgi:Caspase domain/Concanavalin A-like lectin/glucanases superfamily
MKPLILLLLFLSFNSFSQKPNLKSGLVAFYTFDDNINDASGNLNNGIGGEGNKLTYTYDRFPIDKSACTFHDKSFFSVKNSESFKRIESEDAISVSFWVNTEKIDRMEPAVLPIISKFKASNNEKWSLEINANGSVEFTSLNNKTIDFKCILKETKKKRWHHIVFTFSNANQKAMLYVDGELSEEKKFTEHIGSTEGNLFIGRATNLNSQIWKNRLMDELRIYSRAITSQEVNLLYNLPEDKTTPEIIISYPDFSKFSKVVVSVDSIKLKGSVDDESQVRLYLNDDEVKLKSKFAFEIPLSLKVGVNELEFFAIDSKQNQRKKKLTIERKEKELISFGPIKDSNNRGPRVVSASDSLFLASSTYYALIIGNNNYNSSQFEKLDEPINDAQKLYEVLTKQYTFDSANVVFLKNATRETIIDKLDSLNKIIKMKDNILIFYAGHGLYDKDTELGYWIPIDAKNDKTASWIENEKIKSYLKKYKSKHTLVIADACFGGSIYRGGTINEVASKEIVALSKMQSRKAMTSGTLTAVPDKSKFLQYLVESLQENNEKYIPADLLFNNFRKYVMENSETQPQYGTVPNTDDKGGQFIFIKR